jgi:hypothetical protein
MSQPVTEEAKSSACPHGHDRHAQSAVHVRTLVPLHLH